ncbi:uncharacterized protein ACR2FA_008798 [Aphomia sociella]
MSDNEDLLGDDLGDQSLADYNLGNEEEEQLLADDYESGSSQNVPTSIGAGYGNSVDMVAPEYSGNGVEYGQSIPFQPVDEAECVVPNITVEVPNTPIPEQSTYAPYEPPIYRPEHAVVPPPIPATVPLESSQIVPSEMPAPVPSNEMGGSRERFISERPPNAPRQPQIRDIPDSLDKVVVPRMGGRGWRGAHPYRRRGFRGNFSHRPSFPPPQIPIHNRPSPPQIRHEVRPEIRPEIRPDVRPNIRPEMVPMNLEQPMGLAPGPIPMGPDISPERPMLQEVPFRPPMDRPFGSNFQRFPNQYRPNLEDPRHFGPNVRPNFEPRPMFSYPRPGNPRSFGPPVREIAPYPIPQVTIRQPLPGLALPKMDKFGGKIVGREQEVRMLPLQLPPNLPPGGLAGKKVLINPHFKGNIQPPVEGLPLPTYIPTRIQKSPPISPTLESKFGPIKDIDDAAERFIAEQRNALARAANRKFAPQRRSPQRYIENTTIEIENELAASGLSGAGAASGAGAISGASGAGAPPRRSSDDELLRRQEAFINANRAGLRRRMRSPSPPRRSPSPRRTPERRRASPPRDEESEYRRRLREQESLRERVLRAKEVRRRRNAVAMHRQLEDRERERQEKEVPKLEEVKAEPDKPTTTSIEQDNKPDTTRASPEKTEKVAKIEKVEKIRERSPVKVKESVEVNSTCEPLTPPRALTPPLPARAASDDELELILGDIDGILSDDDDSGRFKQDKSSSTPQPAAPPARDLRSRLPPRPPRQPIQYSARTEKSPPSRAVASSSTTEDTENAQKSATKAKQKVDVNSTKIRQRITFDKKEPPKEDKKSQSFTNRRVVLQNKITQSKEKSVFSRIETKNDPSKPNPGIFSRAVRTAIGSDKPRIVVKKQEEPQIEYNSDSDIDEDRLLGGNVAVVTNLPDGITDTRLKTLAGGDVQSLSLDKGECSAKITFKTATAAEGFKRKFNNKMVSKSKLTVVLR